jgi:hypothetical protein
MTAGNNQIATGVSASLIHLVIMDEDENVARTFGHTRPLSALTQLWPECGCRDILYIRCFGTSFLLGFTVDAALVQSEGA